MSEVQDVQSNENQVKKFTLDDLKANQTNENMWLLVNGKGEFIYLYVLMHILMDSLSYSLRCN